MSKKYFVLLLEKKRNDSVAIIHKSLNKMVKVSEDANTSKVTDLTGQLQDVTKLPLSHFLFSTCQRSEWVVKTLSLKMGKMNCNRLK